MHQTDPIVLNKKQHPSNAVARERTPDFPQSSAQGTTQRHTHGPTELNRGEIDANGSAITCRQAAQPIKNRFGSAGGAVKDQRNFDWAVASQTGSRRELVSYMVRLCKRWILGAHPAAGNSRGSNATTAIVAAAAPARIRNSVSKPQRWCTNAISGSAAASTVKLTT